MSTALKRTRCSTIGRWLDPTRWEQAEVDYRGVHDPPGAGGRRALASSASSVGARGSYLDAASGRSETYAATKAIVTVRDGRVQVALLSGAGRWGLYYGSRWGLPSRREGQCLVVVWPLKNIYNKLGKIDIT